MHPKIEQNGVVSTAIIAIDNIFGIAKGTKFKVLQKAFCNLLQFHFHIIASSQKKYIEAGCKITF